MTFERNSSNVFPPQGKDLLIITSFVNETPLCIDLDGTLVLTDTLLESLLLVSSTEPSLILRIPFWLMRGRASLKHKLSERVTLDISSLHWNQLLVDFITLQHAAGRRLVLVTGADIQIAREVAKFFGFFDEIIASDGVTNLTGRRKAEALQKRFGKGGFDYAGNEYRDLKVWAMARRAIVVSTSPALVEKAAELCEVEKSIILPSPTLQEWLKALRVHQWTKNLLVFLPVVCAHAWGDFTKFTGVFIAFLIFCIGASSVYILNDLLDLASDRRHASKRRRPFASGKISLLQGMVANVLLLILAASLAALTMPRLFCLVFAGYYLLTLLYSHHLKRIVLIDVIVLASLYCIRIFAGGAAAHVPVSKWLLAFSLFLFLSLAFAKRFTELRAVLLNNAVSIKGRGYQIDDLELVGSMGITSGYIAVLVLAFYINNPEVTTLYQRPEALWLACVAILYWISRVWLLAHRGSLHDDPVVFAMKDPQSWLTGLILVLIALAALPR